MDEWRIVFYISSGIYLFGAVFYGIFVSAELQSWAKETEPLNSDRGYYGPSNGPSEQTGQNGQTYYENRSYQHDS